MDYHTKGYEDLELSTQLLVKEALRRNVSVEVLDRSANFIRLRADGTTEYVKQATRTSRDTYMAPLIMENKAVTKHVLTEAGIRVPAGRQYARPEKARDDYRYFSGRSIVVKPNNTNFGLGVSILGEDFTPKAYEAALRLAFTLDSLVLVEEFIPGREYRFLVVGGEVAGILHRLPANVTGDGRRTITELVAAKNLDPRRGHGYTTPLEEIRLGETEIEFLAGQGRTVHDVPRRNETVCLRRNSNISTGGDSVDFTDIAHDDYKLIAVAAAGAVGAVICGADLTIRDITSPWREDECAVIELNFNPALHIHAFPHQGRNRFPERKVLDLLGFREEAFHGI